MFTQHFILRNEFTQLVNGLDFRLTKQKFITSSKSLLVLMFTCTSIFCFFINILDAESTKIK